MLRNQQCLSKVKMRPRRFGKGRTSSGQIPCTKSTWCSSLQEVGCSSLSCYRSIVPRCRAHSCRWKFEGRRQPYCLGTLCTGRHRPRNRRWRGTSGSLSRRRHSYRGCCICLGRMHRTGTHNYSCSSLLGSSRNRQTRTDCFLMEEWTHQRGVLVCSRLKSRCWG